jgi:E2/UBC family protein E
MAADLSPAGRRMSRLRAEVQLLAGRYGSVNSDQQDGAWVHVPHFPLPSGWNKREVEILIDIPYGNPGYPTVPPDWFWTDRDLRLSDGRNIGHFFAQDNYNNFTDRTYLDKGWGHFCVHLTTWRPSSGLRLREGHTLLSYLDLMASIFRDRQTLAQG